jgi:hypothetical protein
MVAEKRCGLYHIPPPFVKDAADVDLGLLRVSGLDETHVAELCAVSCMLFHREGFCFAARFCACRALKRSRKDAWLWRRPFPAVVALVAIGLFGEGKQTGDQQQPREME